MLCFQRGAPRFSRATRWLSTALTSSSGSATSASPPSAATASATEAARMRANKHMSATLLTDRISQAPDVQQLVALMTEHEREMNAVHDVAYCDMMAKYLGNEKKETDEALRREAIRCIEHRLRVWLKRNHAAQGRGARGASTLFQAAVITKLSNRSLMEGISAETARQARLLGYRSAVTSLWCAASIGAPEAVWRPLAEAAMLQCEHFVYQNAAKCLWSFARLGVTDASLIKPLVQVASGLSTSMPAQEASTCFWAATVLGVTDPALLSPLLNAVCANPFALTPELMADTLWAAARHRIGDTAPLFPLLEMTDRLAARFSGRSASIALWALAELNVYGHSELKKTLIRQVSIAYAEADEVQPVVDAVYAAAVFYSGVPHVVRLDELVEAASRLLSKLEPAHADMLLRANAAFGASSPVFHEAVLALIARQRTMRAADVLEVGTTVAAPPSASADVVPPELKEQVAATLARLGLPVERNVPLSTGLYVLDITASIAASDVSRWMAAPASESSDGGSSSTSSSSSSGGGVSDVTSDDSGAHGETQRVRITVQVDPPSAFLTTWQRSGEQPASSEDSSNMHDGHAADEDGGEDGRGTQYRATGTTRLRNRVINASGCSVVMIRSSVWESLNDDAKEAYLKGCILKCNLKSIGLKKKQQPTPVARKAATSSSSSSGSSSVEGVARAGADYDEDEEGPASWSRGPFHNETTVPTTAQAGLPPPPQSAPVAAVSKVGKLFAPPPSSSQPYVAPGGVGRSAMQRFLMKSGKLGSKKG